MALVTIRILDGPERGKAYHQIATPVTIGREEGNYIQLNDERVSRYHLKIHENGGEILLTDLQSTNGTRVNGEVVQVWHLRPGDVISLGRSVLIFGTTEEIAIRLSDLGKNDNPLAIPMGVEGEEFSFLNKSFESFAKGEASSALFEIEIFRGISPEELAPLHFLAPPELPKDLTPVQAARMSEFLQYILLRLRYLVLSVRSSSTPDTSESDKVKNTELDIAPNGRVSLNAAQWQNLVDFYEKVAKMIQSVTEP